MHVVANTAGQLTSTYSMGKRRKDLAVAASRIEKTNTLHKTLSVWSLISFGVGCVVGAGIFVITGKAAAKYAGPALSISFLLCAIPCILTGLCYGELTAMLPVSGSAYSFALVAINEYAAWIVALGLTMENLVAAAAVAVGWSATVQAILAELGLSIPNSIGGNFEDPSLGAVINLPAVLIIVIVTAVLCVGIQESSRFNNIAVVIKMSVLVCFIAYGLYFASTNYAQFSSNLDPFLPPNQGSFGAYGITGIFRGAGIVFFANVGFDSICSAAQECKNPSRDMPIALMATVTITSTFYFVITIVLTGLVKYTQLNVDAPVVAALSIVQAPAFLRYFVEVGALAGLTSVCLVSMLAMPRLLLAVGIDGLLPPPFARVNASTKTPVFGTLFCGFTASVMAGFLNLDILSEIVSFGTLVAFCSVCYSAWRLRKVHPDYPRPFVAPFFPYVPLFGFISCVLQLFTLPLSTWRNYAVAFVGANLFYFFYSRHHSKVHMDNVAHHASLPSMEEDARNASCEDDLPKS